MTDQPNWPELKFDFMNAAKDAIDEIFMNAAKDAIDEIRYSTPDSEEEEIWETEFSIPLREDKIYKIYIVALPQW